MLPPFFIFILSSPSGIALHAIRRIPQAILQPALKLRQILFMVVFPDFSSFRERYLKVEDFVTFYGGLLAPLLFLKGIKLHRNLIAPICRRIVKKII
jgi:hypothetical protein